MFTFLSPGPKRKVGNMTFGYKICTSPDQQSIGKDQALAYQSVVQPVVSPHKAACPELSPQHYRKHRRTSQPSCKHVSHE